MQQWEDLQLFAEQQGFEQYEISNFARSKAYSRHNLGYWQGLSYLGLGPSAHSFDGQVRRHNPVNNQQYIRALAHQQLVFVEEPLTVAQQANEYILTSLRLIWGLDLLTFERRFGSHMTQQLHENSQTYLRAKQLLIQDNFTKLSNAEARLLADKICMDLFF